MRLTLLGRCLYGALALLNLGLVLRAAPRGQWIAALLSAILAGYFGIPAVRGRDPLARPSRAIRWLGTPDTPGGGEKGRGDSGRGGPAT